jgi:hypothetical protein
MKKIFLTFLFSSIFKLSFSQNIKINELEKLLYMNLDETNIGLSSLGFSYNKTDSNRACKYYFWKKENVKQIEESEVVRIPKCRDIINNTDISKYHSVDYTIFNESKFETFKMTTLDHGYKIVKVFKDDKNPDLGLKSVFFKKGETYIRFGIIPPHDEYPIEQGLQKKVTISYYEFRITISNYPFDN